LATYSSQIKLANNKELFCELYTYSKQHAIPNYKPQPRAKAAFDLIHIDLNGGKKSLPKANSRILTFDDNIPPTPKGAKYFMIITDDYSRYRWFFALKRKSDAKKILENWITMIQIQFHKTPKRIRTDCGKEWLNKILSEVAAKKGIQ
jgi:Integrase core domain